MDKITLSEISLIHGTVVMPKGFEIDRSKIKNDIIDSLVQANRISTNSKDYTYKDYKVNFSQPLQWLKDYFRDHIRDKYYISLVEKQTHGNVYNPKEQSFIRHSVDPVDLRNSSDYTLIYVADCQKDSCKLIIEYDDNRRKGRSWHIPVNNNCFYMFPSTQRYCITENTSDEMNVLLTINYEYI